MPKTTNQVICKLPKAGLGNQLFPLLKGYVFARLNHLPILVVGFNYLKIGPYLRKEKSKRNYHQYFIFQKNTLQNFINNIKIGLNKGKKWINEPILTHLNSNTRSHLFIFSEIPHWSDSFAELKDHLITVRSILYQILNPIVLAEMNAQKKPVVGVHIRMGDFKKLQQGESFENIGGVRTPEEYFIDIINRIREVNGSLLPVSIFTDGYKDELQGIMKLSNIEIIEGNRDIVDLLLLSKSQIIVTSAGSSFSYWAGFLSDAPIIIHPDHVHETIRPTNIGREYFEGPFDENSILLVKQIRSIQIPIYD